VAGGWTWFETDIFAGNGGYFRRRDAENGGDGGVVYLVTFGEVLVGASLFLGILTRISACAGIFILLNLFFGIGMVKGGAGLAQQETFILLMVVFILSNAGKTLGLDGYLFKRK